MHRGDTVWSLVRRSVGSTAPPAEIARLVPVFYRANRSKIGPDPNRIVPGQHLTVPGPSTFPAASGGVFGDLDGDRHSDVFTTTWQKGRSGSQWMRHSSTGHTFTTTTGELPKSDAPHIDLLVEGRLDSDRRSEVYGYGGAEPGPDLILSPVTAGDAQLSLSLPRGDSVSCVVSGNFDGTGHDDLAAFVRPPHGPMKILVYRNTGTKTPTFSTRPVPWATVDEVGSSVAVGDFDADGRDDLVTYQPGELRVSKHESVKKSTLRLLTSTGHSFERSPDAVRVDDEGQSAVVGLRSQRASSTLLLVDMWDPSKTVRRVPIVGDRLAPPQRWAKGATPPAESVFKVPGGGRMTAGDFNGDGYEDLAEATTTFDPTLRPVFVWLGHGRTGGAPHRWFAGKTRAAVAEMATRGMVSSGQ